MPSVSPSSPEASRRMARVRQRGTDVEIELRRALHALGLRYRLQVPLSKKPRRVADIVFIGARVAVFVDGCFWHGCPLHATWPKENAGFWRAKIEANRARDADTTRRLRELGWEVIRVWSHEDPVEAARLIYDRVLERKGRAS
ncbi:very short patch repair endonuclease [Caldimonas manganoxidans]|uniref:very short patch repair endonuclease n=1 Tax=Caldimonas manganoxidans TaxID=196015 RepID=UPI0003A2C62B|nr:very short patch repair endonuclease [Caldimonas manganoxidans]